jgi:xanthine dehydrogenase accessory factor
VKLTLLEQLLATARTSAAVAVVTNLATGAQTLVSSTGSAGALTLSPGELTLSPDELTRVRQSLDDDRSGTLETVAGLLFIEVWNPKPRLLVIGAVHTAQELVPLARAAGYEVTVIDPRTAFGTAARFPNTTLSNDWPDTAIAALSPDRRTAILTLTHDPKIDDPALEAALRSEAFYIGALGSRRTHAKRVERLKEVGFETEAIARIRGPVGLPIGAQTPVEIAISIMAEITAVLRRAPLAQRA